MNLKEYLTEAVARRTTGKYNGDGFPETPDFDLEIAWLESKGFDRQRGLAPIDLVRFKSDVYCYTRITGTRMLGVKFGKLPMVLVHVLDTKDHYGYVDGSGDWTDLNDFDTYKKCVVEEIDRFR